MKLTQVRINSFRSVKEPLKLGIDKRITVLIGANDSGKTNLLEAVLTLNDDTGIKATDENWDLIGEDRLEIEHEFELDAPEAEKVHNLTMASLQRAAKESESTTDSPIVAILGGNASDAPLEPTALPDGYERLRTVTFKRKNISGPLGLKLPTPWSGIKDVENLLLQSRPRVELFASVSQYMDTVTLPQLEEPAQEFMQGIFRYAGIWDVRKSLFKRDPGSAKRLERASTDFTNRIREEWKQGENLTFKFEHAGQNGNQIELLITDPAVSERFVRPSERSAGFSAFFMLNMRLLTRTELNSENKYVYLFDEPGTALHPAGQINLQRVFERLSRRNQIVYTTHSLFMVNHNRPERNRVVSKDTKGTILDQKPYLRNWRAVRNSLGLILAGNFFIADTTLLVEGESDAMYLGAVFAAYDRAEIIDIDLNLFSVQWAGNARDFEPMARLMLEEGRHVVAVMDGDRAGNDLKRKLEHLNNSVTSGRVLARGPAEVNQFDRGHSIEDLLPSTEDYLKAVVEAAQELIAGGYRELAEGVALNAATLLGELRVDRGGTTLGRHVENVTSKWFKVREGISKLAIARHYCSWLETADFSSLVITGFPAELELVQALKLESKLSEEIVFQEKQESVKATQS